MTSKLKIVLEGNAAELLKQYVTATEEANELTLTIGEGHSGFGVYMHETEYPEEGSVFLQQLAAPPAAQADGWTGNPRGLLQDDSRPLSKWLASKPDAMRHAREAAAAITPADTAGGPWKLVPMHFRSYDMRTWALLAFNKTDGDLDDKLHAAWVAMVEHAPRPPLAAPGEGSQGC